MSFILGKGDYIELKDFTLEERKEVQQWLEVQGNIFYTGMDNFKERPDISYLVFDYNNRDILKTSTSNLHDVDYNNRTQELIEAMKKDKSQELPEEFIIVNADNMIVRQWLKDKGYTWCGRENKDLTEHFLKEKVLSYIKKYSGMTHSPLEYYKEEFPHLPIITPTIVGVTGFTIEQSETTSQKEIRKMEAQIKELQESLNKLKAEQGN